MGPLRHRLRRQLQLSRHHPRSTDPAPPRTGWIARYASPVRPNRKRNTQRPSDYHKVLLRRLEKLRDRLTQETGPFESRCFVDTGPVVERVYARYAGIGWIGKNTCILNQQSRLVALPRRHRHLARRRAREPQPFPPPTAAAPAPAASTPAPPARSSASARWTRPAASPTSPSRSAARSPKNCARHRPPGLRLRHLPGRLPLEPPRAPSPPIPTSRPRAGPDQPSARLARRAGRSRLRAPLQRLPRPARKVRSASAQPRHRHGKQRPAPLSPHAPRMVQTHRSRPGRIGTVGGRESATGWS